MYSKKLLRTAAVALLGLMLAVGQTTTAQAKDPLLQECGNYKIVEGPQTGVLTGFWLDGGEDGLSHALVIKSVQEDGRAEVLYSHGEYSPWGIDYSECEKFNGKFLDDNTLVVKLRDGRTARYEFVDGTDIVNGTYTTSSGGSTTGTFTWVPSIE